MKYFLFIILLFSGAISNAQKNYKRLDSIIKSLPDITVKGSFTNPWWDMKMYLLSVKQPLDHNDPSKGYFNQQVMLRSRGLERPTIIETEGYELSQAESEMERILNANQIDIEQRYFGKSIPDSLQWEYLTYEQCAADWHHINQIFKTIYKGKWVSTGSSRGGQNATFYKYYYPNDVDATVAFVTPILNSRYDNREFKFLDTISTKECRDKLLNVQLFLLKHKVEVLEKLKELAKEKKYTFEYFGSIEKAFEYCIMDYSFSFWQDGDVPCDSLPTGTDLNEYMKSFLAISNMKYSSDKSIKELAAHHYMATMQSGYYQFYIKPYEKYLQYFKGTVSASLPPMGINYGSFDNTFISKVSTWANSNAANMIYIYGSRDPYTSFKVNPSSKVNSVSYIIPDKNHMDAQLLSNMPVEMQIDFVNRLKKILGVSIDVNAENIKWQMNK